MADELEKAKHAVNAWRLGQTSTRFESSGRGAGVISTGRGDHGGVSYGEYQLSYNAGTLDEYLGQSSYREQFHGLTPATQAFNDKWREIARTDPAFAQDQHDFIGRSHFDEQNEKLKRLNIDLSDRGRSVQDAIWSTSVQLRNLTPRIFDQGLQEKFGPEYKLSELSDYDIVSAVQDYKIAHNNSLFRSSPSQWPGLQSRAHSEKAALMQLALNESLLAMSGQLPDWRPSVASPQLPGPFRDIEELGQQIQQGTMTFGTPMTNGMPDYLRANNAQRAAHTHATPAPAASERDAPQHINIPPQDTQRSQAPGPFAPLARTAASEPDPVAARLAELQREMDALRQQVQHDSPSPHSGPAPRHETDLHTGARSAAIGTPSRSRPERESEFEPPQPQPHSQSDAQAFHTSPRDYALFEAIRRQLPDEYSDDMAAHATLEAKKGGISRPDQIRGIAVENGHLVVMGKSGVDFAIVELTVSAPPMQETLQQTAAFDQQQAYDLAQFREQQRQINLNQSGPTMRL